MKNNRIQHIFFDLDHTLCDFDKNSELTFDTIFKQHYPQIKTSRFIEKYVPINQACWKLYQYDKITHEELRYKRLKDSFDALGQVVSDDAINQIADDYITSLPNYSHLFDGATEILDYLSLYYQLHIITNGFANVQYKKMHNSKIDTYFKTITNSEVAGAKKPNALIFQHALDSAQAKREHSIMIGDCLEADVQGAIDFGIDAVFFNPNKEICPQGIIEINHLLELKEYL